MARAVKITSGPTGLSDGLNRVGLSPTGQNQTSLFADTDVHDDWIDESLELLLNSDTTQSVDTSNFARTNEFEETDMTQQVVNEASKRQTYRRRLRNERETLKQQVSELTKDLAHLRKIKKNEHLKLAASRTAAYFFWKNVACRQLELRTTAEAEQKRLSTAIKIQSTYTSNLREIIQKRYRDEAFELSTRNTNIEV